MLMNDNFGQATAAAAGGASTKVARPPPPEPKMWIDLPQPPTVGGDLARLQWGLKALGWYKGALTGQMVTGDPGDPTWVAYSNFIRSTNLANDESVIYPYIARSIAGMYHVDEADVWTKYATAWRAPSSSGAGGSLFGPVGPSATAADPSLLSTPPVLEPPTVAAKAKGPPWLLLGGLAVLALLLLRR